MYTLFPSPNSPHPHTPHSHVHLPVPSILTHTCVQCCHRIPHPDRPEVPHSHIHTGTCTCMYVRVRNFVPVSISDVVPRLMYLSITRPTLTNKKKPSTFHKIMVRECEVLHVLSRGPYHFLLGWTDGN